MGFFFYRGVKGLVMQGVGNPSSAKMSVYYFWFFPEKTQGIPGNILWARLFIPVSFV